MNRDRIESKSKKFKQNNMNVLDKVKEGNDRLSILYQKVYFLLFRFPTQSNLIFLDDYSEHQSRRYHDMCSNYKSKTKEKYEL